MMFSMRLPRVVGFIVALALLTSIAAGLSALNMNNSGVSPAWVMISRFVVVLVFGAFGLTVARACQLRGSLIVTSEEWLFTVRDFVNFGVLPGIVLGVINYFVFFNYRYSPAIVPRIRNMNSFYDSFILSLNSGLLEEIVYRLFIMSCFVFTFKHLYARLKPLWPSVVAILPVALALVLSSLLFAMVHDFYAFTAAFCGGMLLGLIYLKGGIEGAIAAHFMANFIFFSASYLLS
jgi:membrane protease YdiL (CAAX protease family)